MKQSALIVLGHVGGSSYACTNAWHVPRQWLFALRTMHLPAVEKKP